MSHPAGHSHSQPTQQVMPTNNNNKQRQQTTKNKQRQQQQQQGQQGQQGQQRQQQQGPIPHSRLGQACLSACMLNEWRQRG